MRRQISLLAFLLITAIAKADIANPVSQVRIQLLKGDGIGTNIAENSVRKGIAFLFQQHQINSIRVKRGNLPVYLLFDVTVASGGVQNLVDHIRYLSGSSLHLIKFENLSTD